MELVVFVIVDIFCCCWAGAVMLVEIVAVADVSIVVVLANATVVVGVGGVFC